MLSIKLVCSMLWLATKMEIRNVFVILRIRFRCIALILVKNLDEIYLARSRLQVTGKSFLRALGINVKVDIAKRSSIAYRTFIAEPQNYIKVNQETVRKHKTLKKWRLFIDFWLTGINWHYWLWWWPNIFLNFLHLKFVFMWRSLNILRFVLVDLTWQLFT